MHTYSAYLSQQQRPRVRRTFDNVPEKEEKTSMVWKRHVLYCKVSKYQKNTNGTTIQPHPPQGKSNLIARPQQTQPPSGGEVHASYSTVQYIHATRYGRPCMPRRRKSTENASPTLARASDLYCVFHASDQTIRKSESHEPRRRSIHRWTLEDTTYYSTVGMYMYIL